MPGPYFLIAVRFKVQQMCQATLQPSEQLPACAADAGIASVPSQPWPQLLLSQLQSPVSFLQSPKQRHTLAGNGALRLRNSAQLPVHGLAC
jgi:hypothetical protein